MALSILFNHIDIYSSLLTNYMFQCRTIYFSPGYHFQESRTCKFTLSFDRSIRQIGVEN